MSSNIEPVAKPVAKPMSFRLDHSSSTMYYNSKELQAFDQVFYYGCKTKPRNILVKKNVPSTEYLYANFNSQSKSWILSNEDCKKAQLLISKAWVESHMHSMREELRPRDIIDEIKPPIKKVSGNINPIVSGNNNNTSGNINPIVSEIQNNISGNNNPIVSGNINPIVSGNNNNTSEIKNNISGNINPIVSDNNIQKVSENINLNVSENINLNVSENNIQQVSENITNNLINKIQSSITNIIKTVSQPVEETKRHRETNNTPMAYGGGGGGGEEPSKKPVEYEPAPLLLCLTDNEKFKDADGNILEIETVCRDPKNRTEMNTFFRCSDVSKAFDMPNLNKIITRPERSGYEENTDYKYFKQRVGTLGSNYTNKNPFDLYLTYEGLIRVLFVSRNKHATPFRKWATAILFTHQMGTKEAKINLGTDLLNITPKTYKAVFDSYASTFPCIYLLRLGTVGILRDTFGIDPTVSNELSVYKYGFTEDLSRRIKEHSLKYGKMSNVTITLSTFHVIDSKYTSEAEGDVREFVETFQKRLNVDGHNELVALTDKETAFVKKQYASIGSRYAGATAELTAQIAELKARIKELENELITERLNHANAMQKEQYEKKLVEMQRDSNAEIFKWKENYYQSEVQLLKQSSK
jgi:hypothetical protein